MKTLEKYYYSLLISIIYIVHLVNLYIWLKLDINYLTYDSHRHFLASLNIYNQLIHPTAKLFSELILYSKKHPPLVMFITAPFYRIFGTNQDVGVFISSAFFLLILVFSVYGIGKFVLGSKKSACLAVFILTMYPVVFNQMKVYMLDFPLMSLVALGIYLLMCIDKYRRLYSMDLQVKRRESEDLSIAYSSGSNLRNTSLNKLSILIIIFLIICLAGMLVKPSFFLFVFFPALLIFKEFFSKSPLKRSKLLFKDFIHSVFAKNKVNEYIGILSLLLFLIFIFLFFIYYYFSDKVGIAYIGHGNLVSKMIKVWEMVLAGPRYLNQCGTPIVPSNNFLLRIHAINWYIWGFINWQVSFIFFVLFIPGLVVFIRKSLPYKRIILTWLIFGFLSIASLVCAVGLDMEGSAVRYTMPVLPAVAIISVYSLAVLKNKFFVKFITGIIIFLSLSQFFLISYHFNSKVPKISVPITINDFLDFLPERLVIFDPDGWTMSGSVSGSRPGDHTMYIKVCKEIISIVGKAGSAEGRSKVLIIPDDTRLWYLQYLALKENKKIDIACDWNYNSSYRSNEKIKVLVKDSDYIIDKEGGWQGESYMLTMVDKLKSVFHSEKSKFILLRKIPYPDGATILVYKKSDLL